MILSGTLHWMISQSIFLLAIDFYDEEGKPDDYSTTMNMEHPWQDYRTLGFSPAAILSVIIMASIMVVSIVGMGCISYRRGMPLAGSNSRAISAACHSLGDGEADQGRGQEALEKLQWGVMETGEDGLGHCGFSSNHVTAPVEGEVYAGSKGCH